MAFPRPITLHCHASKTGRERGRERARETGERGRLERGTDCFWLISQTLIVVYRHFHWTQRSIRNLEVRRKCLWRCSWVKTFPRVLSQSERTFCKTLPNIASQLRSYESSIDIYCSLEWSHTVAYVLKPTLVFYCIVHGDDTSYLPSN